MKKFILFITFISITMTSNAQIHEIGLFAGGSNYIGDVGPEYYINPNTFMGGIIYKWNKNPRIALRGTFTYTQISSNDADATNEGRKNRALPPFYNTIKELAVGIEFNYFEYNLDDYKKTSTPYIIVEIAAFNYSTVTSVTVTPIGITNFNYGSKTSFALPFGIGYKTKLFGDLAVALELRARYTFEDDLDFNNPDIPSLTFGNPNSNDWYMLTGLSLVYSFGRPPCYATPY